MSRAARAAESNWRALDCRRPACHNQKQMLIPQYSLRAILAATAVCGFFSLIGAAAIRGSPSAAAVSLALLALIIMLGVHALVFFAVWLFSLVMPGRRASLGQSPFAPFETPAPENRTVQP